MTQSDNNLPSAHYIPDMVRNAPALFHLCLMTIHEVISLSISIWENWDRSWGSAQSHSFHKDSNQIVLSLEALLLTILLKQPVLCLKCHCRLHSVFDNPAFFADTWICTANLHYLRKKNLKCVLRVYFGGPRPRLLFSKLQIVIHTDLCSCLSVSVTSVTTLQHIIVDRKIRNCVFIYAS